MDGLPKNFKANERKHKERDSWLKQQFINESNDDIMIEIIRELIVVKNTMEITRNQVPRWAKS